MFCATVRELLQVYPAMLGDGDRRGLRLGPFDPYSERPGRQRDVSAFRSVSWRMSGAAAGGSQLPRPAIAGKEDADPAA
jgi:hypothetical protein